MKCHEIMKTDAKTCNMDDTLLWCAKLMLEHNVGFLPVVSSQGKVMGVITDRDLVIRGLALEQSPYMPVSEIMSHDLLTCEPYEYLSTAERRMSESRKSRILVLDNEKRCIGIISLSDIAQIEEFVAAGRVLASVTQRETSPHVPLA